MTAVTLTATPVAASRDIPVSRRAAMSPRPLASHDILARQLTRLADWWVQTRDDRVNDAVKALGVASRDFDALCDATADILDLADGEDVYGRHVDCDRADMLAAEAHADALAPVIAAAWARAGGAR